MTTAPATKLLISFDADGTLFDTEYLLSERVAALATSAGFPVTAETLFTQCAGMGCRDKFNTVAALANKPLDEATFLKLEEAHAAAKADLFKDPSLIKLFNNAASVIKALTAEGHTICLASNGKHSQCRAVIKAAGLAAQFGDRIYTPESVQGRSKPDPAMILHAMRENGFTAANTIHIDDAPVGAQAGKAAGTQVVAFIDERFGEKSLDRCGLLMKNGARGFFADYKDLPAIIKTF